MSLKVILVDDDNLAVFLQKITIEEAQLTSELLCFYKGAETLDFLDRDHSSGDDYFIFLDINMPVMTGWDFLEILNTRSYADKVSVAMVSSYPGASYKELTKKYPQIIHVFEKPVTAEICREIKKLPALSRQFSKLV